MMKWLHLAVALFWVVVVGLCVMMQMREREALLRQNAELRALLQTSQTAGAQVWQQKQDLQRRLDAANAALAAK